MVLPNLPIEGNGTRPFIEKRLYKLRWPELASPASQEPETPEQSASQKPLYTLGNPSHQIMEMMDMEEIA